MPRHFALLLAVALAGCQTARPPAPAEYVASGNEPFWSIATSPGAMLVRTPGNISGARLPVTRSGDRFSGTMSGRPVVLAITRRACRDSMSGARFDYSARLTRDGASHDGCARRADQPVPLPE